MQVNLYYQGMELGHITDEICTIITFWHWRSALPESSCFVYIWLNATCNHAKIDNITLNAHSSS